MTVTATNYMSGNICNHSPFWAERIPRKPRIFDCMVAVSKHSHSCLMRLRISAHSYTLCARILHSLQFAVQKLWIDVLVISSFYYVDISEYIWSFSDLLVRTMCYGSRDTNHSQNSMPVAIGFYPICTRTFAVNLSTKNGKYWAILYLHHFWHYEGVSFYQKSDK